MPARQKRQPESEPDVPIVNLLASEGFVGEAGARARAVLEAEKLTRPGKVRISRAKLPQVREILAERLVRVCDRGTCATEEDGRAVVRVPPDACEICGGSRNRRAGQRARQAFLAAGAQRLLVLGGTRTTYAGLREALEEDGIEVRWVDGTGGVRSVATVEADLAWADVLVVWASTPLPHKVSQPYTARGRGRLPMLTVSRRGVEAVCLELVRLLTPGA